jgi:hypothetical protein
MRREVLVVEMTTISVRLATTECNRLCEAGEMNLVERCPQSGTRYSVDKESHLSAGNWNRPVVFTVTLRGVGSPTERQAPSSSDYTRSKRS